ncbi:MAG: Gfo/Idh/MocA family oxidoreductase [Planctomycetota bacterium]
MSGAERLRFGICGLGFMGQTYYGCLREHPRAKIVAVCDRDAGLLKGQWDRQTGNLAVQGGQRVDLSVLATYTSVEELIDNPAVDVVAITLPTPLHADITVRALAAGKHVICEKPMALTLAECDRMIEASCNSGRLLMIAQCIRFWPQYALIKQYVDEGRIGAIRFVKLTRVTSPPDYSSQNWLMDGSQSGGALFDLHVHDVDFIHYLLGKPATIHARGARGHSGQIDHVLATYSFIDGSYALLEGGWIYNPPWPFEMAITVCGEHGTLTWQMSGGADVKFFAGGSEPETLTCGLENGYLRELDYFISCIMSEHLVEQCSPESTRRSIALALLEREAVTSADSIQVPTEV